LIDDGIKMGATSRERPNEEIDLSNGFKAIEQVFTLTNFRNDSSRTHQNLYKEYLLQIANPESYENGQIGELKLATICVA
jgi:hypothetical protein